MLKKVLVLTVLAGAVAAGSAAPALAAGPSLCVTSNINVAGTAAPTNGTTCLP